MPRALVLLVLLPLVVACGARQEAGSPQGGPDNALAAAAGKATDAGSSRVGFDMTMTIGDTSDGFRGTGLFDYKRQRGQFAFDMSEFDLGTFEILADGFVFYMRVDALLEEPLPGGRSWIKVDQRTVDYPDDDLGELSPLSPGQSPAQLLEYLRASSKEIETKGEEKIRGVLTTHYRALIDIGKAAELSAKTAPPHLRERIRKDTVRQLEKLGLEELPMDVWIDGEGLPRRVSTDFPTTIERHSGTITMSMDLYDYGVPVRVRFPAAADVVDLAQLTSGAE